MNNQEMLESLDNMKKIVKKQVRDIEEVIGPERPQTYREEKSHSYAVVGSERTEEDISKIDAANYSYAFASNLSNPSKEEKKYLRQLSRGFFVYLLTPRKHMKDASKKAKSDNVSQSPYKR